MKAVILGSGNVASHLSFALKREGIEVLQIFSPTYENAKTLGEKLSVDYCCDFSDLNINADIYIISIKDSTVETINSNVFPDNKIVVHTSGSLPMEILNRFSKNFGVLYPLQTFSKEREIFFKEIPVCIEANSDINLEILRKLAKKLSDNVIEINSEKRKILHLSAVFACNFTNYMYTISENILMEENISFDILKPLIKETAAKVQSLAPVKCQTGPAVRSDKKIRKCKAKS